MNRDGVAVGQYCASRKCDVWRSFVYRNGHYRNPPVSNLIGSAANENLTAINDSGEMAGSFFDSHRGWNAWRGFTFNSGTFRYVDAPKAAKSTADGAAGTFVVGLANNGDLSGTTVNSHHRGRGFIRTSGNMHVVDVYPAYPKSWTSVYGINNSGKIVVDAFKSPKATIAAFIGNPA